jgi:hypothetical protein
MATPRPSISQYFQIETADNVSYADDFANVQKSLESSKTSYVNQLKENAKEIQAMYNKVDQQLGEFTSGQSDLEFGNPSVNWDDTWRDSKTEYANLSRKIVAGQGTAADKQRISQLDAMVSSTIGNISNLTLLAQSAAEARQNPGKMGGIDMTSNSADTLLAMEILNGNTKGSKKLVTNLKANPPTQAWEVYDNKGQLIWTRSTGDIEQMLEKGGSGGVTRVPDETQTMENNTSSLRLIGEDGKAGEINDDYYIKDASGRPALKTRILSLPDGSKKIETYNELDMAAIKGAIGLNIRAGAEGLSDSDKESAIALYNNVLGPGQRDPQTGEEIEFVPIDATNFVWEGDIKEKYEKAYVNYNLNNFLKKDRQVKIEAYKVPTVKKGNGKGKGKGKLDPRALEIRDQLQGLIKSNGTEWGPNAIVESTKVAEVLNNYGVNNVLTLQQIKDQGLEGSIENRDKEDSIFILDDNKLKPIKAFTQNPTIKGLIEGYRTILNETGASAADKKAWNDATADLYSIDITKGNKFK